MRYFWRTVLPLALLLALAAPLYGGKAGSLAQTAADGQDIFQQKCSACHTVGGGDLVGPDLQGVTQRRPLDWLRSFILDPQAVVDSGDETATQLVQQFNGLVMPSLVSEGEVESLLAYLESASGGESAPAEAPAQQPQVQVQGRREVGEALFRGEQRFANGGLPCAACHGTSGLGTFTVALENASYGSLGPDLTNVYSRLGAQGLQSVLQTLPFPVMQPIYTNAPLTPQEQADLAAYFQYLDENAQTPVSPVLFWGTAAAIALGLFGLLALGWNRQRTSISDQLRRQA